MKKSKTAVVISMSVAGSFLAWAQPCYSQAYAPWQTAANPAAGNPNSQLEQMMPSFNQAFSGQAPPSMAAPMNPGPGFGPGLFPAQPQGQAPTLQEQRVGQLEQRAFGSTYPEHEVDDRVEHLEREVFGKSEEQGDIDMRLAKLEGKLGGGGAFGKAPATGGYPPQQPAFAPPQQPAFAPVQQPAFAPVQQPAFAPQQQPAFVPPQQPAFAPVQQPAFAPQQQPAFAPPQQPAFVSPQQPAFAPVQQPAFAPQQQQPAFAPVQQPAFVPQTAFVPPPHTPAPPPQVAPATAPRPQFTLDRSAQPADDLAQSEFETAVMSIPCEPKAGDYFPVIQRYGGCYARWTSFPVRIHLPMNTQANWQAALQAAIRQWAKAVPVMVAPTNEPADVEIAWINHLQPRQLGITNLEVFNGHMRVTIYLLPPNFYPPGVPETMLPTVATHEIGHALGLWGHSTLPSDIMQSLDSVKTKASTISARDINTLRRVYQSPGLPAGFQSPQPVGWAFTHYAPLRKSVALRSTIHSAERTGVVHDQHNRRPHHYSRS